MINDHLELQSAVKRLPNGRCAVCNHPLTYLAIDANIGKVDDDGTAKIIDSLEERNYVVCPICGYTKEAIQIGLKMIPIDRISELDIDWDRKYLEENTLIFGKKGENPFKK